MPLEGSIGNRIREFHKGPTFAKTAEKFGRGRANKQAIAVALESARRIKRRRGGLAPLPPATVRPKVHKPHVGAIASVVPGRTDKHPMSVPTGAYVLPADHISHMGQGNTLAGLKAAEGLFGRSYVPGRKGRSLAPKAAGGAATTPIVAAGGEFVISPHAALKWFHQQGGRGGLPQAHEALDKWVMDTRKKHIEELAGLPPPATD